MQTTLILGLLAKLWSVAGPVSPLVAVKIRYSLEESSTNLLKITPKGCNAISLKARVGPQ